MISRPIKEGIHGIGRHWAMSISSAIAVTITLTIVSLFLMFTYHVQKFTLNFESEMHIAALVDYDAMNDKDEAEILKKINAIEGVSSVTYRTKEEEFEWYINQFEDERTREVFEPFRDDNPMHDAYYIEATSGDLIRGIADQVEEIKGISEVNYGGQSTISMVSALETVRKFGLIFVIALTLLAIFLIQNTIKLTIAARQDEISIMRNVGATNGFIRAPFVWEGIFTGIMGSVTPIILTIWGYQIIYDQTGGVLFSNMFTLMEPIPFTLYLSGILLVTGILVGLIGSWLSVTRYLRWTR